MSFMGGYSMIINKNAKLFVFYIWVVVFFNLGIGHSQKGNLDSNAKLSINLKSQAVVVGPSIKLGDIGYVVVADSMIKVQLSAVLIGVAPPPGESSEISLIHVKRCLLKSGFKEYIANINGPNIIRVTTAQEEIDKAFLKEVYAQIFTCLITIYNS